MYATFLTFWYGAYKKFDLLKDEDKNTILYQNKLMGKPRIRQVSYIYRIHQRMANAFALPSKFAIAHKDNMQYKYNNLNLIAFYKSYNHPFYH